MTTTREFLDLAVEYSQRYSCTVMDARKLVGGPFSLKQISDITGVSQRRLRNAYKDHERPGGRLAPDTLPEIRDLRYQNEIGQRIDKGAVWRVILSGTSERVLARLTGIPITDIRRALEAHSE